MSMAETDGKTDEYSDDHYETREHIRAEVSYLIEEASSNKDAHSAVTDYFMTGPWTHVAGIGFSVYAHTEYPIVALNSSTFSKLEGDDRPYRGVPEYMIISEYSFAHFGIAKTQYEAKVGFDPTCYDD